MTMHVSILNQIISKMLVKRNQKVKQRKSRTKHISVYDNLVVNLSNRTLTQYEHEVLSKGLKFCLTVKGVNAGDEQRELDTFQKNLSTIQFFNKDKRSG